MVLHRQCCRKGCVVLLVLESEIDVGLREKDVRTLMLLVGDGDMESSAATGVLERREGGREKERVGEKNTLY